MSTCEFSKVRSKNGEPVGKFPYLGKYAPYAVDKHIIRKHVTRWSQISGQINSIYLGLVDTACFLKETPPMHYRQRIPPVNDTYETNCINHCCHSHRLLGGSLHCLKSSPHLLIFLPLVRARHLTFCNIFYFLDDMVDILLPFRHRHIQRLLWPVRMAENC